MHKQHGVTLVELLVSVFIGLLALEGFTRFYLDQRVTNQYLGKELEVQKKNRLMLGFFKGFVEQSGYQPRNTIGISYTSVFPASTQFIAGEYMKVRQDSDNSQILFRYHHEDQVRAQDCVGREINQPLILEQHRGESDKAQGSVEPEAERHADSRRYPGRRTAN